MTYRFVCKQACHLADIALFGRIPSIGFLHIAIVQTLCRLPVRNDSICFVVRESEMVIDHPLAEDTLVLVDLGVFLGGLNRNFPETWTKLNRMARTDFNAFWRQTTDG